MVLSLEKALAVRKRSWSVGTTLMLLEEMAQICTSKCSLFQLLNDDFVGINPLIYRTTIVYLQPQVSLPLPCPTIPSYYTCGSCAIYRPVPAHYAYYQLQNFDDISKMKNSGACHTVGVSPCRPYVSLQIRSPPNNNACPRLVKVTLLTPFIFGFPPPFGTSFGGSSHSSTNIFPINSPPLAFQTSTPSSVPSQTLPCTGSVDMPPLGAVFGE